MFGVDWLAGLLLRYLGESAVKLALEVYRQWAHDQSIRNEERGRVALQALTLANEALVWKAAAATSGDGGARLRVRDGAGTTIELPGDDPRPPGGAA